MAASTISIALVVAAAIRGTVGGGRYEAIRSGSSKEQVETDDNVEQTYPSMSVVPLNRFIFDGNVVQCLGQHTDHWIVQFCPSWYSPCQTFLPMFRNTSVRWQDKLNSDIVLRSRARFAEVDCATDKELCNEQLVEDYPTVVHYLGGKRVSRWTVDRESEFKGLDRWVQEELRSAKEPLDRAWPTKSKVVQESLPPARPTMLSILAFLPIFACPVIIVIRGVRLAPSEFASPSAPSSRPWTAAKQLSEEPHCPVGTNTDDASAAESSVSKFMPAEWASELKPIRGQSMEL